MNIMRKNIIIIASPQPYNVLNLICLAKSKCTQSLHIVQNPSGAIDLHRGCFLFLGDTRQPQMVANSVFFCTPC
jgi:hypothetical protein